MKVFIYKKVIVVYTYLICAIQKGLWHVLTSIIILTYWLNINSQIQR